MRRWLPPASTVDGVVWPPILTGAHATLAALVHHLEVSQWLPREQIERLQRAQLARLAEHCAQHSPHFRLRLRESELKAADLAEPGGLERLAPLTRRRIQRAGAHLFCDRVPEGHLPRDATASGGRGTRHYSVASGSHAVPFRSVGTNSAALTNAPSSLARFPCGSATARQSV